MTVAIPDVLPKLVIELRTDPDVAAIVGTDESGLVRVRGYEPEPGDAQQPGQYRAFVVLVQLSGTREPRVPIQRPIIAARCYGRSKAEAAQLRWAVSNALHGVGPRVHGNGLGIYQTFEETGGDQDQDPDTQQPLQTLTIAAVATTQAVAV